MAHDPPAPLLKFSPSALVLDMDGLLINSEPLWFEVERVFCVARGGTWTKEDALFCTGRGVPATLEIMAAKFGFPVDIARDTEAILDAFIENVDRLSLMPGCLALLDAAFEVVPLALASSSPRRLIDAALRRFELAPRFRAVVSGQDVARLKPAPDIFLRAAAALGVAKERCAVLEDSLAGATAGRAAGMFVIAVPEGPWEGRGFEAVADRVVSNLVEARDWLELPSRS